jgi:polyhydroxyalkanoate synthesis regulator phasin
MTKEFFAILKDSVNSEMDNLTITYTGKNAEMTNLHTDTYNLRDSSILELKGFPVTVSEHPEDRDKQFHDIQAQIQTYLNDASTVALVILCQQSLNTLFEFVVDHYISYDDMAAKNRNSKEEHQKYLDDKLRTVEEESENYEKAQHKRNEYVADKQEKLVRRGQIIDKKRELKRAEFEREQLLKRAELMKDFKNAKEVVIESIEKRTTFNFQTGYTKAKFVTMFGKAYEKLTVEEIFGQVPKLLKKWYPISDSKSIDNRRELLRFFFSAAACNRKPISSLVSYPEEEIMSDVDISEDDDSDESIGGAEYKEEPIEGADALHRWVRKVKTGHGLKKKVGRGLHAHDCVIKNKYYVDSRVLGKGLLELRYTKNGHLTPFKSMTLDNDVHKVISDMIHKGAYNVNDYVKLPPVGKHMVAKFGGYIGMPVEHDDTFQQDFNITRGELASGNNNAVLKDKMKKMLLYAVDIGQINRHQMLKIWSDLKL